MSVSTPEESDVERASGATSQLLGIQDPQPPTSEVIGRPPLVAARRPMCSTGSTWQSCPEAGESPGRIASKSLSVPTLMSSAESTPASAMTGTTKNVPVASLACPEPPVGDERATLGTDDPPASRVSSSASSVRVLSGVAQGEVRVGGADSDDVGVRGSTLRAATRLLLGSADPHGLGLSERQVPIRCRSAFNSLAHLAADDSELVERPFAVFNAAPLTERRELPEDPAPGAPVFTSLLEIVPKATLMLASRWRRRLRRCLAFAVLGNVSMAKRMCPHDLWLPVSKHMTDAARPWDWDLRPLALGGSPVPWPVSGRNGLRPSTDLNLEEIELGSQDFLDQEIVGELKSGLEDDARCARGTLLCAPHTSALQNMRMASEKLEKIVSSGWGFVSELPAWPIRACPYGLVDESERAGKPKWRLTNDLSWPPPNGMPDDDGGYVESLNASMSRSRWPKGKLAKVSELAEAAAIMRLAGVPVKLWKFDCDAFYKRMGRQTAQLWRVAMAREDGIQVDTRCCFGSAADAAKCSRVSNFLHHHVKAAMAQVDFEYPSVDEKILAWQDRRAAVATRDGFARDRFTSAGVSAVYIDDGLGVSFDDVLIGRDGGVVWRDGVPLTRATAHFESALAAVARFGFPVAPSKTVSPCGRAVFLGVEIDTVEGWMRLDPLKRGLYLRRVREALSVKTMPRAHFLRLLGRLQFAAMCLPRGRQWMHAAWRAVRTRFRLSSDSVLFTKSVIRDLRLWEEALACDDQPTAPLAASARLGAVGDPGVGAMYADASGNHGWSAWTCVGDEVFTTGGEWTFEERSLDISVKELYASTAGLATLAPIAGWSAVYNFTDSMVALATMHSATPQSLRLQALSARRVEMLIAMGLREAPERVSSQSNLWADLGSRGNSKEVVAQASHLGLSSTRLAVAADWVSMDWLLILPEG